MILARIPFHSHQADVRLAGGIVRTNEKFGAVEAKGNCENILLTASADIDFEVFRDDASLVLQLLYSRQMEQVEFLLYGESSTVDCDVIGSNDCCDASGS